MIEGVLFALNNVSGKLNKNKSLFSAHVENDSPWFIRRAVISIASGSKEMKGRRRRLTKALNLREFIILSRKIYEL